VDICRVAGPCLSSQVTLAAVLFALLAAAPAGAHSGLTGGLALWDGALHILLSPLSLAAVAGVAAILCGIDVHRIYRVAILSGVFAGTAYLLIPFLPACAAPGAVAVLGLVGVAAWKPAVWVETVLAILAGLASGVAAALDDPNLPTVVGAMLAQMLLLAIVLMAYRDIERVARLEQVLPVARRVLASWVAAMGLLMTALAFQVGKA
jgi:hypothetical protein